MKIEKHEIKHFTFFSLSVLVVSHGARTVPLILLDTHTVTHTRTHTGVSVDLVLSNQSLAHSS